ncbi:hypothetical protein ACWEK5_13555 [Rhodococcus koreensis]
MSADARLLAALADVESAYEGSNAEDGNLRAVRPVNGSTRVLSIVADVEARYPAEEADEQQATA